MSQEIEIEFKNILTKDEFDALRSGLGLSHFVTQHNDYFDTADYKLKKNKTALRVREKSEEWVLTMKEPHEVGKLETHQALTKKSRQAFFETRSLEPGDVTERLKAHAISPETLLHLGRLTTHRAELPHNGGLLVLDHSEYLDQEDFELEWEFSDYEFGKKQFHAFLDLYQIPKRPTQNKIMRFFLHKNLKESYQNDPFR